MVLGESSAEGVPFQKWLSIGGLVKWQLEESIGELNVRLTILARSGDTLANQHEALAGLKRRPEILIVYCGHNEFSSRFFALRDLPYYFLDQRAGRMGLVRRRSRATLTYMRSDRPINRSMPDRPATAADRARRWWTCRSSCARNIREFSTIFDTRLEQIVSYANSLGALVILISPPGNDADFEPNRSFLPEGTALGERESFRGAFLEARRLEGVDSRSGLEKYRELVAREPGFAETHYRLATLLRKAGEWDEAYRHFVSARDLDGYPMRCLTVFQEVYREVASRHDCILIDGQSYFHAIGRNGLLDDDLFQDAMHPSLRGQIALAQAVVYAIQGRRAFGWPAGCAGPCH